jgi:hypothetical protein
MLVHEQYRTMLIDEQSRDRGPMAISPSARSESEVWLVVTYAAPFLRMRIVTHRSIVALRKIAS